MTPPGAPVPPPNPVIDDPDTGGFWAAAARGVLAISTCADCSSVIHLPMPHCTQCGGWDITWREVAPTGWAYSWTVVEHQVHPAFPTPYTLVLVELDELPGTRLLGRIDGRVDLVASTPLRMRPERRDEGVVLPNWEPAPTTVQPRGGQP